jgi:hypothetical protein
MPQCNNCKREVEIEKIHAFYPEDSSHLCCDCFGEDSAPTAPAVKKAQE